MRSENFIGTNQEGRSLSGGDTYNFIVQANEIREIDDFIRRMKNQRRVARMDESARGVNDHTSNPVTLEEKDYLLMSFHDLPENMRFKRITSSSAHAYLSKVTNEDRSYTKALYDQFNAESITYNTRPNHLSSTTTATKATISNGWNEIDDYTTGYGVRYGLAFFLGDFSDGSVAVVTSGTNAPYLTVTVDDSDTIGLTLRETSPTSGTIIKTQDNTFTWRVAEDSDNQCAPALEQASAVFRWRSGTSGTIHTINVSGNTQSVTVPANTFAGTTSIQWQVAITANSGVTTTSDWVTLSTADATPTASPLSPVDTVIDGSKDVLFQWQHSISTGTAQSKADLQKSTDGSTWTALTTVTGAARQWTCPAGTLTSSIKYWRVRTYNADGIAGAWSDAAQIVVIAAPSAPSIQIKSTGPRPSISWQTSEQEAYQVELDGKLSGGTHYGTEKTWTSPAYLADGSHTVRVRVQNQYGMWSNWGTAALPVTNTPGASITLTVQASSVAGLSWQTSGSYDFYLVYRNGKPIAKLTQTQYTDELSSGSTTYQVRGCYADSSNYGLSGAVTATITTGQYVTLYGIASGKKVTLKHCGLKNQPVQNAINRDIQYIFMYGSTYPHAERSEFVTKKVGGTAVFLPGEDKAGFDALIGELVCLKTQSGEMVIGYLNETSDTSRVNPDKSVCNFSIQQIDYSEVIDIDS